MGWLGWLIAGWLTLPVALLLLGLAVEARRWIRRRRVSIAALRAEIEALRGQLGRPCRSCVEWARAAVDCWPLGLDGDAEVYALAGPGEIDEEQATEEQVDAAIAWIRREAEGGRQ